ncbi:DNA mismatch repair protein MutS2 [Mesoflavibacter sabulilitoris]|uniref:DNA mismatch repair protein MutS n=1 Tax=Mesoflavibacter zeaxanthinifaciens subsp. sabulilitoris TaxID=1520893 RepID=A0A2T1NGF3_9FLAO|nr:DNA mismatch repair protein MutS [Mesoflavibacter zeaxanthinifaciens]MBB3122983.1 DNA mismatch repair protein MutS2 [Mesoflavibacter zeaxanthinifaciens subsp. sabulilitoris]PSG91947.1 DNA mismatch repair protein MutS [Mesoflavibacter zeaxanthinifaciens subsp. sabulilitoris]
MINIHQKTLQDLEFATVLNQVSEYCITALGNEAALSISPYKDKETLLFSLQLTNEYISSFYNDNRIPNHGFDSITKELKLLKIENTFLEPHSLKKLVSISLTSNDLIKFFKKFETYYPTLQQFSNKIEVTTDIINKIDSVVNRFNEVKDDASPTLYQLRQQINKLKGKINSSFTSALNHYHNLEYLDDIRESVVDNKRVLAVKAMYRRKVKGAIMGGSKTGSIVYIEPETTLQHTRELNNLQYEEGEEVVRILKEVTNYIRFYLPLLELYQSFLTKIDVISAKAKYAKSMNAILPEITENRELYLRDAFHPLLYLNNLEKKEITHPQTIQLKEDSRIIVISGPNAGGKSITLKTVGLLQVMLQSGLLIPVHERSKVCLFDRIVSDIGDNQSIENHLSTYSYRLKQMNYFLKKINKNTLFLIDEFGTGSDPELGGALAETFLEEFYARKAFGIITTHYANLKLLANEKDEMINANMMFNERTLEPMYKLALGQAGSSFTFEVAQKNGIPYSLINRAKKKIERSKVRFDATIAKLQKERAKLEKTGENLKKNEKKKQSEADKLEEINAKIQKKLESYQELYDSNQRLIYLGQKVNDLAEGYFNNKRKRELMSELFKLVQIENSKRKKQSAKQAKAEKAKQQKVKQEAEKKVEVIRKKKKEAKKKEAEKPAPPKPVLKVGDRVRMQDGKAVGSIDNIDDKGKAVVNYGIFTTNVSLDQLELVEAVKKQ